MSIRVSLGNKSSRFQWETRIRKRNIATPTLAKEVFLHMKSIIVNEEDRTTYFRLMLHNKVSLLFDRTPLLCLCLTFLLGSCMTSLSGLQSEEEAHRSWTRKRKERLSCPPSPHWENKTQDKAKRMEAPLRFHTISHLCRFLSPPSLSSHSLKLNLSRLLYSLLSPSPFRTLPPLCPPLRFSLPFPWKCFWIPFISSLTFSPYLVSFPHSTHPGLPILRHK